MEDRTSASDHAGTLDVHSATAGPVELSSPHAGLIEGIGESHGLDELIEAIPLPVAVLHGTPLVVGRTNLEGRALFGEVDGWEVARVVEERRFRSLGGRVLRPDQVVVALKVAVSKEGFRFRMRDVNGSERIIAVTVVPSVANGSMLLAFQDATSEFGFEEKRIRFVETAIDGLRVPLSELQALVSLLLSRFGGGREPLAEETTQALAQALGRVERHARILEEVAALRPIHSSELRAEVAADLVRAAWEVAGGRRLDVQVSGDTRARVLCSPRHVVHALAQLLRPLRGAGGAWVEVEISRQPASIDLRGRVFPPGAADFGDDGHLALGAACAAVEASGGELSVDVDAGLFSLNLPFSAGEL